MPLTPSLAASLLLVTTPLLAQDLPSFDPKTIDANVNPCVDFFDYANGSWIKNNPIPGEYSIWGSFIQLAESNNQHVKSILEEAASDKSAPEGSIRRKIGDFYAAGMDVDAVNRAGITPLQPEFDRIAALKTSADFPALLAHFHLNGIATGFNFFADQDAKDSTRIIAQLFQGGLGLPDRDYYTRTDAASQKQRDQYLEHVAKMFGLLGDKPIDAAANAKIVLKIETSLAEASMTNVQLRDPNASYHKLTLTEVQALTPNFDWKTYLAGFGLNDPGDVNVGQPEFLKRVNELLKTTPIENWKTYFRWHLITGTAEELSDPFVNENFRFYGQVLTGAKELKPRWKRVLAATNGALGEAVGQLYVEKYFPPEAKSRVLDLVAALRRALRERIAAATWMGDATKKAAFAKLDQFTVKMGYPDKWRDYSSLLIDRNSYVTNVLRGNEFEVRRTLAKIGKPVDRTEWLMTPQTVNAYYNPSMNEIVFPAGILQPPFFGPKADDAINFGGIGAVIGHEMTHGFDDQGRQYDASGNLKEWWTPDDLKNFNARAQKIIDQYGNYVAIGDLKLNGELTQGENIADNGGVRIAWTALQEQWAKTGKPGPIDGFTPEQRFFLGWAQVWRSNIRDEALRTRVLTDPHSPAKFRVNGVVSNMPEFFKAFGCDGKSPLERPASERAEIW
ncbi:MAG TPA: M13 family metallopeptidase [Chthoniobacterales bacterium]